MKRLLGIASCLLLLLSCCTHPARQEKKLLVITDLGESHSPFSILKQALEDEFGTDGFSYKYVTFLDQDPDSIQYFGSPQLILDSISRSGYRPDLLVLCGDNVAHGVAACSGPLVEDVPAVFIGVQYPEYKGLLENRPNFTGFRTDSDIRKNLDFIRQYRHYTWVTTSLDSGYMDDYLRDLAVSQLSDTTLYNANVHLTDPFSFVRNEHRDSIRMTLIPLSAENDSLNWKDHSQNIGFNYSYMLQSGRRNTTYLRMKDDRWSDMALFQGLGPYFTMTPQRFDIPLEGVLNICIGGYFAPYPVMMKDLHGVADDILFRGKSPADIPWGTHKSEYWFNWKYIRNSYRFSNELPKGINFVNLPWSERSPLCHFLDRYKYLLLGLLLTFSLILSVLHQRSRRNRSSLMLMRRGTEAKEISERINSLVTANNGFFFNVRKDGKLEVSEEAYKFFHLGSDVRISDIYRMIVSENKGEFIRQMEDENAPMNEMIISLILPEEEEKHYVKVLFSHPVRRNSLHRTVGMMIVIDGLIRRQEEIDAAYRREEESVLKSSFLASMGHEIRTPLNAIVGFSKLLVEMNGSMSDEEKTQYGDIITANTEQLLSLIDNVISTSEEQSKDFKLDLSEKNVDVLMDELYMTHSVIVPQRLKFIFSKGDPSDRILVNRSSLLQVVSNLMNNAVKFTDEGSITLGWTEDENHVIIYVQDTGCGIAPDMLDKIFKKYVKAGQSEGAGLGLPLCKRLVGLMHGEIKVKSEPGVGSRFEVIFQRLK